MDKLKEEIDRAVVRVIVEKTLLELGPPAIEQVESSLQNEFSMTLEDCYNHPEQLKRILQDLFGKAYVPLFNRIRNQFDKLTLDDTLEEFITILGSDIDANN